MKGGNTMTKLETIMGHTMRATAEALQPLVDSGSMTTDTAHAAIIAAGTASYVEEGGDPHDTNAVTAAFKNAVKVVAANSSKLFKQLYAKVTAA